MFRVSEWFGPSTRAESVSSRSNAAAALATSPAPPTKGGKVKADSQGVEVVWSKHPQHVCEQQLERGDSPGHITSLSPPQAEVMASDQGVGVVVAESVGGDCRRTTSRVAWGTT